MNRETLCVASNQTALIVIQPVWF